MQYFSTAGINRNGLKLKGKGPKTPGPFERESAASIGLLGFFQSDIDSKACPGFTFEEVFGSVPSSSRTSGRLSPDGIDDSFPWFFGGSFDV